MKRPFAITTLAALAATLLVAACTSGDSGNSSAPPAGESKGLHLLAGALGGAGFADGAGADARFRFGYAMASDATGTLYLAEWANNTIRKITPAGVVSTLAGKPGVSGSTDGVGSDARFFSPSGVAVDAAGNVFVSDASNATVRKITPAGVVSTIAGKAGEQGNIDGNVSTARFLSPWGVAVDPAGNVYVIDQFAIRKISATGSVSTLAGSQSQCGSSDGQGAVARFCGAAGIAVESDGGLLVADSGNHLIRRVSTAGVVSTVATVQGLGTSVTIKPSGHLLVDSPSNCGLYDVAPDGTATFGPGAIGDCQAIDGNSAAARFIGPHAVAMLPNGAAAVVDNFGLGSAIRIIASNGQVSTLAGATQHEGNADGPGVTARFGNSVQAGVVTDSSGNTYLADASRNTIRKIAADGTVSTLAGGVGVVAGFQDGLGSSARFSGPSALAIDRSGNLYVADGGNRSIRKVTPAGSVTTVAGAGPATAAAHVDGQGTSAVFSAPSGIAIDAANNIYVIDGDALRVISSNYYVSTVALVGSGAVSLAGAAGIAVDAAGKVYVSETGTAGIRVIDAVHGASSYLAGGSGVQGDTDGLPSVATFYAPGALAFDAAGALYVADGNVDGSSTLIRKVAITNGAVSTVAGTRGTMGVKLGTLPGSLNTCTGLSFLPSGDLVLSVSAESAVLVAHGI